MKEGATPYTANKMLVSEKSKLIFNEILGSELYWNLRCRIKEELLKNKTLQTASSSAIEDMISKMVKDLGLEPELKNKVFEIYDTLLKEETPYTWAKFKLKDCQNIGILPPFYTEQLNNQETLECIVQARIVWDEFLKQKVETIQKNAVRPYVHKRVEIIEPEKKELEESKEEDNKSDSQEEEEEKEVLPPRIFIYEISALMTAILKIKSDNYAADPALGWGSIKVNLQTRSLEELRTKFAELNIALRQIGVDEEKTFVDERILIGERLLQKNSIPLLAQYAKRGIPHTLRQAMYKKLLNADYGEKVFLGIYLRIIGSNVFQ